MLLNCSVSHWGVLSIVHCGQGIVFIPILDSSLTCLFGGGWLWSCYSAEFSSIAWLCLTLWSWAGCSSIVLVSLVDVVSLPFGSATDLEADTLRSPHDCLVVLDAVEFGSLLCKYWEVILLSRRSRSNMPLVLLLHWWIPIADVVRFCACLCIMLGCCCWMTDEMVALKGDFLTQPFPFGAAAHSDTARDLVHDLGSVTTHWRSHT